MDYEIRIGAYRLMTLDSVTIEKSVENLSDKATIVIPGTYINQSLKVEDKIKEGDAVTIRLGYNNNLETEFQGYLNSIATDDATIRLECEDALYLFKKSLENKEYKSITLSALLTAIASEVNNQNAANGTPTKYSVNCNYSFTWKKFTVFKATSLDVLKKIQEETKANIYFKDDVLHIHPTYSEIANVTPVVFDFAKNIEKSDLKYVRLKDKKIEVEVTASLPNGNTNKMKYGQPGGIKIDKVIGSTDALDMKRAAENEYKIWAYDGYEGSFTGWLIPYIEPSYQVSLIDSEHTYKNGVYYVIATEVSFSSSGGQRKIKLGRRIA
jgi:hypothetical protein